MAEDIGDVLNEAPPFTIVVAAVWRSAWTPRSTIRTHQQRPHGVADVMVAALGRERWLSRLKHADGVRALVAQMRHEGVADVLGEWLDIPIGQEYVCSILLTRVVTIDHPVSGWDNCKAGCGDVYRGFEFRTNRAGLR
jgi:hypothetical protein